MAIMVTDAGKWGWFRPSDPGVFPAKPGCRGWNPLKGRSPLWKRLRRRTMAPSRPLLYPDQIGLLVFTLVRLAFG
jgi:hypothetical protein